MSKDARRELLEAIRREYAEMAWREKSDLLSGFVAATGYNRKYATKLLNERKKKGAAKGKRTRKRRYDGEVEEALKKVWLASNRLCSKRLVPFLPKLVESMERFGYLSLAAGLKKKLLCVSAATVDRILKEERKRYGRSKSTTKPGRLLKRHIPVRTFAGWNELEPGFLEADSVAHCGETLRGQYLSTLTMTDIATGWTECLALPAKTESAVAAALSKVARILPIPLRGLDTDNGSEFINSTIVSWCAKAKVTFTRSREYKKNDQAHVEEKNGSVVRRYVGYDRYEGEESFKKLTELYRVVRLFINYFQPSMKLSSKQREGGKVSRTYERAMTPCERLLQAKLPKEVKEKVRCEFKRLDPVFLLKEIERLQIELWKTASVPDPALIAQSSLLKVLAEAEPNNPADALDKLDHHRQKLRERRRKPKVIKAVVERKTSATGVTKSIHEFLQTLRPGRRFTPKELLSFGPRNSVDQALHLLVKAGAIVKIGWGRYSLPMLRKKVTTSVLKTAVNQ